MNPWRGHMISGRTAGYAFDPLNLEGEDEAKCHNYNLKVHKNCNFRKFKKIL